MIRIIKSKYRRGFTLIEMSISMAILGLVVGGALLAVTGVLEKARQDKTRQNLDKIENALTMFVLVNSRLPCPDNTAAGTVPTGLEGSQCGQNATADLGVVPYQALGILKNDVLDGWNHFIDYVVDDNYTTNPPGAPITAFACGSASAPGTQFSSLTAAIQILNAAGTGPPDAKSFAAYALISHGHNGLWGKTTSGTYFLDNAAAGTTPSEFQNSHRGVAGSAASCAPAAACWPIWQEATSAGAGNKGFDDVIRSRPPARILYDAGCVSQ